MRPPIEKTLILIKPDGVKRKLTGEIIQRFERAGLNIVGLKMVLPTRESLKGHFPCSDEWVWTMGERTIQGVKERGIDPIEVYGTDDPEVIGKRLKRGNYDYLCQGLVIAMVLEGLNAITKARKMIGSTLPLDALPGTIRGDFSPEDAVSSAVNDMPVENLVHASDSPEGARREIAHWFNDNELF